MALTGKTIAQLTKYTSTLTGNELFPLEYNGATYHVSQSQFSLNSFQIATGSVTASVNASSNIFNIISGSNTLFVVNNTGSVGIGTTSPAYKLDVNGTARVSGDVRLEGTTFHYIFKSGNYDQFIYGNSYIFRTIDSALSLSYQISYINKMIVHNNGVAIGSEATAPVGLTAALEIQSTTQGFLPPRMTTTQRNAISSPATGLTIYNTTTLAPNTYNGTAWVGAVADNIYTADGTLTGNRTVNLGGYKLNIGDSSGEIRIANTSTASIGNSGNLMIGNPANNGALSFALSTIYFNGANGYHFTIATGLNDVTPSTFFQVRNSGNVLINSTSDTGLYKLDVNGTARVSGETRFTLPSVTNNTTHNISSFISGIGLNGVIIQNYVNENGITAEGIITTTGPINLKLGTPSFPAALYINNNGRVSIGSTAANERFQVNGGWAYFAGNLDGISPSASSVAGLLAGWNRSGGNGETNIVYTIGAGSNPRLAFGSWNGTSYAEEMNLFAGGLVIGSSAYAGYKLDVSGSARVSSGFRNANADFGIQTTIGTTASNSWQSQIIFSSALQSNFFVRGSGNTFSGATSLSGGGILNAICASGTTGDIFAVSNGDIIGDNTTLRFVVRGNGEIQVANGAVINPSSRNFTIGGDITIRGGSPRGDVPNSSGGNAIIAGGLGTGTGTPGDVIIGTATATSSGNTIQTLTDRVWIKGGTGNVGINTTSPAYTLDVNGTARVSGGLTITEAVNTLKSVGAFNVNYNVSQAFAVWYGTTACFVLDNSTETVKINKLSGSTYALNANGTSKISSLILDSSNNIYPASGTLNLNFPNANDAYIYTGSTIRLAVFNATGNIGIANNNTDIPSAILHASSTTKGFLPPRMTNTQRTNISSPAVGLIVYCTDATEGLYVYKSTGWTFIA